MTEVTNFQPVYPTFLVEVSPPTGYTESMTSQTMPRPRIPAAAKTAGARALQRTSPTSWVLGYALTDEPTSEPGNGPAVVAALQSLTGYSVEWAGTQADPIVIRWVG